MFLRKSYLGIVFGLVAATAYAETPVSPQQVPGFYKMDVGAVQVTALYDGIFELDSKLLKNTTPENITASLDRLFIKGPSIQTAVNGYLIHTGNKLVLVDTGAAKGFGPSLGQISQNIIAAGYQPEQVDAVLLTHLHGDHVNGLLTDDGKMAFPNAEIWSSQADNNFWLNKEVASKAPKDAQPFFEMAQKAAAPYLAAKRWKIFSGEQEIIPNIKNVEAFGHTPGHTAYMVGDKDKHMLIWGDVVHSHAVQLANPDVAIEFDTSPEQAVKTRRALLNKVAAEKMLVAGMHMPFPGIGHVRKEGKGYTWVPVEFGTK